MSESNLPEYLYELCDSIDAAVFNGDSLHNRPAIAEFQGLLDRWNKQLQEIEDIVNFVEKEDV